MDTIKIICPECKHQMEYWTRNNFINCTKCKARIEVEPCVKKVEMVIDIDYLVENDIVFINKGYYEDGEDYWVEYYEDEYFITEIEDIDQFIEDYKNKVEVLEVKV